MVGSSGRKGRRQKSGQREAAPNWTAHCERQHVGSVCDTECVSLLPLDKSTRQSQRRRELVRGRQRACLHSIALRLKKDLSQFLLRNHQAAISSSKGGVQLTRAELGLKIKVFWGFF